MRNILAALLLSAGLAQAGQIFTNSFEGAKQPQVAVSADGVICVVFGCSNAVYFVRSNDRGQTFLLPHLVTASSQMPLGMRRGPRIAIAGDDVVVTAVDHRDLICFTSPNMGLTWSEGNSINDVAFSAREGLHALAASGKKVYAAWIDRRLKKAELWGAISNDGGKTWGRNKRIYQSPDGHICECCAPNVVFTPDGKIVVMWRNWLKKNRDLYWAISSDNGETFSAAVKLGSSSWSLDACPMDGGGLAVGPDGKPVSVWRSKEKILTAKGHGGEKTISRHGTQPAVAVGGKDLYYVWLEGTNLMTAISTPSGLKALRLLAQNAAYPAIAPMLRRLPVVVWESNSGLWVEQLTGPPMAKLAKPAH